MKLFSRSLAAFVAATLLAGAADAATTVSTYRFGYDANGNLAPVPTDTNANFTLAGFDTSLGNLTGAVLTYGYYVNMSGTVRVNETGTAGNTAKVKAGVDSMPTIAFDTLSNVDYSGPDLFATQTIASATKGLDYNISGFAALPTQTYDIFAQYLAGSAITGSFNTGTASYSVVGPPSGGNASVNVTSNNAGYATVTYTYDAIAAVPEPASWAMMVGGFGLLGGALRRKRTTAVSFG